jgi:L-fuconate dehydratase
VLFIAILICPGTPDSQTQLEFVDHLHEHYVYPVSINENGRYNVPLDNGGGYSIEMKANSMENYAFPGGAYWVAAAKGEKFDDPNALH